MPETAAETAEVFVPATSPSDSVRELEAALPACEVELDGHR